MLSIQPDKFCPNTVLVRSWRDYLPVNAINNNSLSSVNANLNVDYDSSSESWTRSSS